MNEVIVNVDFSGIKTRVSELKKYLCELIIKDLTPVTPVRSGEFLSKLEMYEDGVRYNSPIARFLNEGKVMVDPETGSAWARQGVSKITTNRDLHFTNTASHAHWVETTIEENLDKWKRNLSEYAVEGEKG